MELIKIIILQVSRRLKMIKIYSNDCTISLQYRQIYWISIFAWKQKKIWIFDT